MRGGAGKGGTQQFGGSFFTWQVFLDGVCPSSSHVLQAAKT